MYDFIEGVVEELTPSHVVINAGGVGYDILISLNSYTPIAQNFAPGTQRQKMYIYLVIREDMHLLYGFVTKQEREIFKLLISVSGVGVVAARMILSSLTPDDVSNAIFESNAAMFKSVKGIGTKTAERIIVDLRNKVNQIETTTKTISLDKSNLFDEAVTALTGLGFQKAPTEKVVSSIIRQNPDASLETLIRKALGKL